MLPKIERYEITDEIGHGGMATVYRARDTRLDRWVAVKVMHPHLRGTQQARARFAREARAVARLKHPAILEIYDYSGSESEDAYIATELLTGPTLKAFVEQVGSLLPEIVACIGVQLASALSAAHGEGVVHRDVKPENVLLHESRTLKLTDFGIADMVDPSMSAMTVTGQILGSPAHMAPEQVEGGETDGRSDVFALGTILYWLATEQLPFSGKNAHQVLKRVVEDAPIDPLRLRPVVGRPLRDVILRCLEKRPEDRFQTADELARALRALLASVGIDEPESTLEAYLTQPEAEAARLSAQITAALLHAARAAVKARNRIAALALLDRVLSFDDGNGQALSLVAELDRRASMRLLTRAALSVLVLGVAAGLWIAFAPLSEATSAAQRQHAASAPVARTSAHPPDPQAKPAVLSASGQQARAGSGKSAGRTIQPRPKASADAVEPAPPPRSRARTRPASSKSMSPRVVVFDPEPANVSISVDGAALKPFGPSYRKIELAPGPHVFRFVGAHACCEDLVLRQDIEGGPGETVIEAKLKLRDARIYVVSDVPADVRVDGQPVGRTRSLLTVPMQRVLIERHRISVTAPGYEPYTGSVQLRAGEVTQLKVSLRPSASP